MCFTKLQYEKESVALKFSGLLAPGQPMPENTLAFGASVVGFPTI
jgi:hypothetical protein